MNSQSPVRPINVGRKRSRFVKEKIAWSEFFSLDWNFDDHVPLNSESTLEAEHWLLQAAKQNSALAWNNLGTLYATKHPELKSRWDDARECLKRPAELGFNCAHPYPPR